MTPIGRQPALHVDVRERLAAAIGDGTLGPGARLVETRIAREFGVSQAVVREALRELEARGLVTTVPHRGASVRVPSPREVAEAHELRAVLEGHAARRALARSAVDLDALDALVDRMERAAAASDVAAYEEASAGFHRLLVTAAEHRLLLDTWESLLVTARLAHTAAGGRTDLVAAAASHRPLVAVLRRGDPDEVDRACRAHAAAFTVDGAR